jgi:tRNA (guanine37-N1)-methyltransferase
MGSFSEKFCPIFAEKQTVMRIDIISVLPPLLEGPLTHSIVKRVLDKGLAEIHVHDLRDYSTDKHRSVDDYSFGGDAGMVMSIEPIHKAITHLTSQREYDEIIYTSPDGEQFKQSTANRLSQGENILILCGHYKGIDQRIRDHLITREISIGDYVLTGGELAAAVICDSVLRLLPGAISDETSALSDSFQDGLLAPPVYTRPAEYQGWKVPDILLSGHKAKIEQWKHEQSMERTQRLRPDLLQGEED